MEVQLPSLRADLGRGCGCTAMRILGVDDLARRMVCDRKSRSSFPRESEVLALRLLIGWEGHCSGVCLARHVKGELPSTQAGFSGQDLARAGGENLGKVSAT
jgi:hypothetical protein